MQGWDWSRLDRGKVSNKSPPERGVSAKPEEKQENMQVSRERAFQAEHTASSGALRRELSCPSQEQRTS